MTYLNSGIFLAPFHDLAENPILALERDFELLQHLDALNYTEAWIGEHHSGGFEIVGSPEVFIAAAAERTKHIRLGTGVVPCPTTTRSSSPTAWSSSTTKPAAEPCSVSAPDRWCTMRLRSASTPPTSAA